MPGRLAILSVHTSPLAQPGGGDGGGMNVYVRSLASALARAGVNCDVYTRADCPGQPPTVVVEPGFRVLHVAAGPAGPVAKEQLPDLLDEFTASMRTRLANCGGEYALFHANYWLSGQVGHVLKHEQSTPLVATFHTLARVKAEAEAGDEPERRAQAEADIVRCSDLILASTREEVGQLTRLYDADSSRVEVVAPGVDHRMFTPGDQGAARACLGLDDVPTMLFVGRIQPLKGVDLAVRALAALRDERAVLVVVGGPSGPDGASELARVRALASDLGVEKRVRFVAPRPQRALVNYYRAADVCLVPSRSESFGLVALEAAACGTPVVASAVGGLRSLVEDGVTGFLVEGRDAGSYAAPVAMLLDDADLAASMGVSGAARSMRYSWSMTAARLRRLYSDLVERSLVECR